jgi:hypothetical protein
MDSRVVECRIDRDAFAADRGARDVERARRRGRARDGG